ncbi:hypothetical protein SCBWM1_gp171 [Synechococcus phage S-CBWM1]|uniref:Uncharacterized protein n=1 Tax=Synechococcus phage S-CBWM1 TaxID=2053653 RepID=A0A3G1L3U5_9CAUD|nr:hypothetical protein HOU61_gp026 [Synechococcus phage S-CBWM1]ATW62855.1 hypothetical protein SCBWM1_gp171 [Synechococcus phage S-CBWM1]
MDLLGGNDPLSIISLVSRKKANYFEKAKELARGAKTQENLEEIMVDRAKTLVRQLHDKRIKWSEYQIGVINNTFIGAMGGAALVSDSDKILDNVWSVAVGRMVPHLSNFLQLTKESLDDGTLNHEDVLDFEEYPYGYPDEYPEDYMYYPEPDPEPATKPEPVGKPRERQRVASWIGLAARLVRYVANPSYSFFRTAEFEVNKRTGYTQMRRWAVGDKNTCEDCAWWDSVGWRPIGELPLPGNSCRCLDRCRCRMEYR